MNTTSILAEFINKIKFEDLPEDIVHETKRLLLDSMGCALGGLYTKKGEIALLFGTKAGSKPEATIIGAGQKAPAPLAAFVNGELLNALDYEALCAPSGHITPYVLSAPLAVAEWKNAGGKDLIVAIAIAHEIAQRISAGLTVPGRLSRKITERGIPVQLPIHGYGVNIFGGIAGVSKILGMNPRLIAHAFGIGGYMCPVPTLMQFTETVPAPMSKFSPSGWLAQSEVTSALLAEMGYSGDRNVLDGEFGFWKSFGADGWDPIVVLSNLGKTWFLSDAIGYKRYPCCGAMHGALNIFFEIINRFSINPEDIIEMNVVLNMLAELSLWKNRIIKNHIDAQFSTAYVFAVAAHRIETGHTWQAEETYHSPQVMAFMRKINILTPATSDYDSRHKAVVEVIVRDKETNEEKIYTERDVWPVRGAMDDEELSKKFVANAKHILSPQKIEHTLNMIHSLEEVDDVAQLMALFSIRKAQNIQKPGWLRT